MLVGCIWSVYKKATGWQFEGQPSTEKKSVLQSVQMGIKERVEQKSQIIEQC